MGNAGQEIFRVLTGAFIATVLYLAGRAAARAGAYFSAELQEKKSTAEATGKTAQAAAFSFAVNVLNCITNTVVGRIEAQKAYALRQAVKAGEAQAEELGMLSTEAYYEIAGLLSGEVKEILDGCVDDTERLIRDKIEELLPRVKAEYRKTLPGEAENAEKAED